MATQSSRTTSGLGQGQLGDDYVAMVVKAGTVGFDTQLDAKTRKEEEELV